MAVCLRCGKQLGATARFCSGCGYPVKIQQTATVNQTGNAVPSQTKPVVCLRCGKELRTGVKFCGTCGYPTQMQTRDQKTKTNNQAGRQEPRQQASTAYNSTGNTVSPEMMTREQLIAEIDRMLVYYSKVQDLYDEYDRYVDIRNAEQDRIQRERYNTDDDDDTFGFLVFLLVFLFGFIGELITHDYQALAIRSIIFSFLFGLAGMFILLIQIWTYYKYVAAGCFIFCGFLCYLAVILFVENSKIKRQERAQMETVRAKLEEYHGNYGCCLVTFENANPRILHRVREYLVSGQAYTLNDALRLAYD